jgi:medium-chain acyl-[acyl-carrier-protein] hydrolase
MLHQTPWFVRLNRPTRPRARLFLFPYAGGSASLFRAWGPLIGDSFELIGIQLPGRERRFTDPLIRRVDVAVDQLVPEFTKCCDLPFSLFGHSNGAILAFEVAGRLEREGARSPDCLIASGKKAPDLVDVRRSIYDLPDELLVEELRELDGTPVALLNDTSMLEVLLPMLRADFEMTETYRYKPREPLKCPIAAFGGSMDRYISEREIDGWGVHTAGSFTTRSFRGGHFFIHDQQADVVREVCHLLNGSFSASMNGG